MIELTQDKCSLLIDEQLGGRIAQLKIADLTLLVEKNENPIAWGSYPMAPWVGRLNKGEFRFENRVFHFPINLPPHAIHGTCLDVPWTLVSQSQTRLELECGLGEHWPFKGKASQVIELHPDSLLLRLCVHSEEHDFPASIGWHPWFKRKLERGEMLELKFEAEEKYQCNDSQIPTGKLIAPGTRPWDDCFTKIRTNPTLDWKNALHIEVSSSCSHWVVYDMPEHAICLEPQTAAADAINPNTLPVDIVTPQTPLCAWMKLSWRLKDV